MSNLKKSKVPDPYQDAYEEFEILKINRDYYLKMTLERIISENPYIEKYQLIKDVKDYYCESLEKIPSFTKYPESKDWVDYVLKRDKFLIEMANLTLDEIAIYRSLNEYLQFRGYKKFGLKRLKLSEKCRVAFIPETDMGPMHIKNVDDPIDYWKPFPKLPEKISLYNAWWYNLPFIIDSVGSGLHIDDEPSEIFPLPIFKMVYRYASDIESCVDFLKKYSIFWGNRNIIIFDLKLNFCVIEKCSRNFIEIYYLDKQSYFGYISGMVCRNKNSPQAIYQKEKRLEYLKLFNFSDNSPDILFWELCEILEEKLKNGLISLGTKPSSNQVINLFISPYPDGLRKYNLEFNDWTLYTHCTFFEKKIYMRWQLKKLNGKKFEWTERPETCKYE
ncbi:MAG: hypothetical protein NC899_03650 [Candidatus Omnitrophica bacterium]|nr:hypothetical protein [Candidatus Omnitrophota bacterium]